MHRSIPGGNANSRVPRDGKQALLHQHVGEDLALSSSPAEEGSILVNWSLEGNVHFVYTVWKLDLARNAQSTYTVCTKCDLVCYISKSVHKVCNEHTLSVLSTPCAHSICTKRAHGV